MSDILLQKTQKDLQNAQVHLKNVNAQCEALKQMHNDANTAVFQLRSTVFLLQQTNQELSQKNTALCTELDNFKKSNIDLTAELDALKNPVLSTETEVKAEESVAA